MYDPDFESRAKAIAIQLINSRDTKNIVILKNFLSFLPSPRCIQGILNTAVLHISETSVETTCWLLQNPEPLYPEVNVIEVVTQHLSQRLVAYGLIPEHDFQFGIKGELLIHSPDLYQLVTGCYTSSDQVSLAILRFLVKC